MPSRWEKFWAGKNSEAEARELFAIMSFARQMRGSCGFPRFLFHSEMALGIMPYGVENKGFRQ